MEIKPIRSEADYQAALQEIENLLEFNQALRKATEWMFW